MRGSGTDGGNRGLLAMASEQNELRRVLWGEAGQMAMGTATKFNRLTADKQRSAFHLIYSTLKA